MKSQRFFFCATPSLELDQYYQMIVWCYNQFEIAWSVSEVKQRRTLDSARVNLIWRFDHEEDAVLFQLTWC